MNTRSGTFLSHSEGNPSECTWTEEEFAHETVSRPGNSNKTGTTSICHERGAPDGNATHLNVEMPTFQVEVRSTAFPSLGNPSTGISARKPRTAALRTRLRQCRSSQRKDAKCDATIPGHRNVTVTISVTGTTNRILKKLGTRSSES